MLNPITAEEARKMSNEQPVNDLLELAYSEIRYSAGKGRYQTTIRKMWSDPYSRHHFLAARTLRENGFQVDFTPNHVLIKWQDKIDSMPC